MENTTAITIDSLIEQGKGILQGIKAIPAPSGVTRIMSAYSLENKSLYESLEEYCNKVFVLRIPRRLFDR